MNCPHCNKDIADKALAKHLASKGGKAKKKYSDDEIQARTQRLAEARSRRWKQ